MIDKSKFTLDFRYALAIPLKARDEMVRHYELMQYDYNRLHRITKTRGSKGAQSLICASLTWASRFSGTQILTLDDIYDLIASLNRREIGSYNEMYGKINRKNHTHRVTKARAMIGPGREIAIKIVPTNWDRVLIPVKPIGYKSLRFYYVLRKGASVLLKPR